MDSDYRKATNKAYKEGYDKGHSDGVTIAAICLLIVGLLTVFFN